jgi:hypothetical protein
MLWRQVGMVRFKALVGLLAVLVAVDGGWAVAMGIRWERKQLARSTDGSSALYEVRGWGPEGGGSLAYRVEVKATRKGADFLVSSTFSPGDGRQPEVISAEVCEQRLAALASELSNRGIQGVAVNPGQCRKKERDGLVIVGKST